MSIHISLELSGRPSKQGQKSILIRLTQHRAHRRISTGIQLEDMQGKVGLNSCACGKIRLVTFKTNLSDNLMIAKHRKSVIKPEIPSYVISRIAIIT